MNELSSASLKINFDNVTTTTENPETECLQTRAFQSMLLHGSSARDLKSENEFVEWFLECPSLFNLSISIFNHLLLRSTVHLHPKKLLQPHASLLSREALWFLSSDMPTLECSLVWEMVFTSTHHGHSWNRFSDAITLCGATLIVVKDGGGNVFGGFAFDDWYEKPTFYGSSTNFLFSVLPNFAIYHASGLNENFQYMEVAKQSLPNGLGMGGQLDYFGLWLSANFTHGHSKSEPLSTTYSNPCLSSTPEFSIDTVEAWCVLRRASTGPTKKTNIMGRAAEMEFLELSGRRMYGKEAGEVGVSED